jgi:hypothetical protein
VHTENVIRNLTRNRDLVSYERWFALKPRFILNDRGELELVPIPQFSEQEYRRSIGLEGELLAVPHENFQPGGPAGAVRLSFPYSVAVVRNLIGFHGFHARIRKQPEWQAFLQPGHKLHGLEITTGIAQKFVQLARERGKAPLVVVLPHPEDFKAFREKGSWPYRPLLEAYAKAGLPVHDFGPVLMAAATDSGKPVETFFGPTQHYNDAGNAVLARFVQSRIAALPVPAQAASAAASGR